jgi:hypothetical protein
LLRGLDVCQPAFLGRGEPPSACAAACPAEPSGGGFDGPADGCCAAHDRHAYPESGSDIVHIDLAFPDAPAEVSVELPFDGSIHTTCGSNPGGVTVAVPVSTFLDALGQALGIPATRLYP